MRASIVALASLTAAAPALAPARAQDPSSGAPGAASPDEARKLTIAAYSLRRQGRLEAAGAALEQVLDVMPKGAEKRLVGKETALVWRVAGKNDRALQLYRRQHDFPGEFELLFATKRHEEALALARLLKTPAHEAKALVRLGRAEEGLKLLANVPALERERADLLVEARRPGEAAPLYFRLQDPFAQGKALEAARDVAGARRAYDDARDGLAFVLRNELLPRFQAAEQRMQRAPDGVARERARFVLADELAALSEAYEKLALAYDRTGQPPEKTAQLAENAARFVERRKATLLDQTAAGVDQFGQRYATWLELDQRIATLQAQAREYAARRPAPPQTPSPPPPPPPRRR